jgi:hypothetical protein
MNEFDVRALGWVVTRDAFWEVVRSLAGRKPRLPFAAMQGLMKRWQTLQAAVEKTSGPPLTRIVSSSLLRPTSAETSAAAADYLTLLSTSCPELYTPRVMDERCRRGSAKAIAGLGGSIGLGFFASLGYSLIADAAVVLFAMGAWHLMTSLQLRCVRRLISQLAYLNASSDALDPESLSRRDGRPHREGR